MEEWKIWLELCRYAGWNPDGPLRPVKYRKHILPYNENLNVGIQIWNKWVEAINDIHALRIAIVGPAGLGKTWMAIYIARILEKMRFKIDQVVFTGLDYMRLTRTLKDKKVIIIEEPTYIASARNWHDEHQQVVVRTLESSRFQNNPIIIPIVNRNLLDKTIREYYINYVIEIRSRGYGVVFRTWKDQWSDKIMRMKTSELFAVYPGMELARCGRKTCLRCPQLSTCNKYIWPQYERARAEAMDYYHSRDEDILSGSKIKTAGQNFRELCDNASTIRQKLLDDKNKYSVAEIMYQFELNRNDAQLISKFLRMHFPPEKVTT